MPGKCGTWLWVGELNLGRGWLVFSIVLVFGMLSAKPATLRAGVAQSDRVLAIPGYGDVETIPYGSNDVMRRAAAEIPLRQMPLAVLAKGIPFDLTEDALGLQLRALVPDGRTFIASDRGHAVHQDQPALVAEAIREAVDGAREPETWYDLKSCCAK